MKQATANHPHPGRAAARLLLAALALACLLAPQAAAQKKFSRDYPAQSNIRLQLLNRSGKIEVVAWEKNTVRVTATMESRSARMEPEATADGVRIDVRRDNREDVGDINFTIRVPFNSTVDISTMSGGIIIRNVRGEMVRAHVTSEGDIQLRITAESGFRLMAVAPRTRNIDLNGFAQMGEFEFFNEKRKVVGKVGDGGASLSTTNGRGSIVFMPR